MTKTVKIDAKGQSLGRLASQVAKVLMGKDSPDYLPHKVAEVKVEIENIAELKISEKKLESETHERYSGYPGGRKVMTWKEVIEKKGYQELLRQAVKGMLPKNKLQDKMLKNLIIK